MRQTSAWFLLVALSLATPSLRADGPAPTPSPSIKQADITRARLSLEFDQPMLTWGTPSSSAMLQLSPAVECAWYWEDDVTLVCERPKVKPHRQAMRERMAADLALVRPLLDEGRITRF